MFGITVKQAATLCGGFIQGFESDEIVTGIAVDSRKVEKGNMFAAFTGEKVDGKKFINPAFEKGASCCICDSECPDASGPVIVVNDTERALEAIAGAFRRTLDIPVVGVTGSVGKTTAKEMIAAVLSEKFRVCKTKGNLNSNIGLPASVCSVTENDEIAVFELGISHFGEMARLGQTAKPDVMVYTLIANAHIEYLNDIEGVLRAKTELLEFLDDDALLILNRDDPMQMRISWKNICTYGFDADSDVCYDNYSGIIPFEDRNLRYAALEAIAVGKKYGMTDDEIARGFCRYEALPGRGVVTDTGYVRILDYTYNANRDSVFSSLDILSGAEGRKVAVLGDMLELGDFSDRHHFDIGEHAVQKDIDLVICLGEYAGKIAGGAGEKAVIINGFDELPSYIEKGDTVLVQASRGCHFEKALPVLKSLPLPIVFIDCDDTILDFKQAEHNAVFATFEYMGIENVNDELCERYSVVNAFWWEKLERREISRHEVLIGRFNQIFEEQGRPELDGEEAQLFYEKRLSQGHFFMPGAVELLESLKGRCRLFLASNGNIDVQNPRLDSSGIRSYFEGIFISELMGAEKPSAEYFEECISNIPHYDPSAVWMIGDSLTSDILGGINMGYRTIWYNFRKRAPRPDIVPEFVVSELSEIPDILFGV